MRGRALVGGRHPERHARGLDPPLRPGDPLGHRRLGHQERARDLGRGQAADRAQGQRDRRRRGQRRMAAHEQHDQRVVLVGRRRIEPARRARRAVSRCRAGLLAAPLVDQPALGGPRAASRAGSAGSRPAASAPRRRAAPPGRRPRRHRSRRTGGRARRGPAAPARAAGPRRRPARSACAHPRAARYPSISAAVRGASSMTCRTWIGCWVGRRRPVPARPRPARRSRCARASVSTSTIW